MKKVTWPLSILLALLATVAALLAACGAAEPAAMPAPTPTPVVVERIVEVTPTLDSNATRFVQSGYGLIEIPVAPKRIAAMNDSKVGAPLLSMGIKPAGMVTRNGEMQYVDRYDMSGVKPLGHIWEPDLEALVELQPDLIIGHCDDTPEEQWRRLMEIAPTVTYCGGDFPDTAALSAWLAGLVNAEDAYIERQLAYEQRIEEFKEALGEDKIADLSVSVVQYWSADQIGVMEEGAFAFGEVLQDIGIQRPKGQQRLSNSETSYEHCCEGISLERMREIDADVIIEMDVNNEAVRENPLYDTLKAVQAGQVYHIGIGSERYPGNFWALSYDELNAFMDVLWDILVVHGVDETVFDESAE